MSQMINGLLKKKYLGPVLVIIPFEDEAEAIKIANDTPYGLAAYMQTGSKDALIELQTASCWCGSCKWCRL